MKVYTDIDLKKNELQYAVIHPLASAPTGVLGQIYYNSTEKKLYQHNGSQWVAVGVTYDLQADAVSTNNIALKLIGDDGSLDTVNLVGAGGATLSQSGGTITITTADNDTTYTFTGTASASDYTITITPSTGSAQTIVIGLVTDSAAGLMSPSQKAKLDGLTPGGEPNQDAFSYVSVGGVTVAADSETDTLELEAGTNVTLTADASLDKVTISATDTTYPSGTQAQLEAGTDTTDRVWSPQILHDYLTASAGFECISTSTTIFTETVTTILNVAYGYATLNYSTPIDYPEAIVTFDGVDYNVTQNIVDYETWYYGDYDYNTETPDFTIYPFVVYWNDTGGHVELYTETAGEHTITFSSVSTTVSTTQCFEDAVKSVGGGGGGSYTATSPIDITSDVISHENSGVTAGTYDGGQVKSYGFYAPSVTVDAKGHVTSATDLGSLLPIQSNSSASSAEAIALSPTAWRCAAQNGDTSGTTRIIAGNTSATLTFNYSSPLYNTGYNVSLLSIEAIDATTGEAVIVDWNTPYPISTNGKYTYAIVNVSIAEAYAHDIVVKGIVGYGVIGM